MRQCPYRAKMADDGEDGYDPQLDYRKLRDTHETAGYREGLDAGEEITLQAGFDEGFAWGTSCSTEWAKLRGVLSALLSYVHVSSMDHQNKDEVISQLTELLKEAQTLEEMINMDNLILSPEHTPSKTIRQNAKGKEVNQDINRSTERECREESCNKACAQETREDEKKAKKVSGTCCKDVDKNLEKSCSSELQSSTVDKTDKSQVENANRVLTSGTEVQNLLLKCKSIVSQLGLNPDTILSPVKHLVLSQQVSL